MKAPSVPVVSPAAVASIVTEPARAPVIVLAATPPAMVALPVPPTVPVPEACAKATTVELSEVTVLPAASWMVAVRTLRRPGREVGGRTGEDDVGGRAVDDGEGAEGAGREPGGGGLHRDGAGELTPVIVLVAMPAEAVALPVPLTVPVPLGLRERDHGRVVGGDGVAGGVLDGRGEDAGWCPR